LTPADSAAPVRTGNRPAAAPAGFVPLLAAIMSISAMTTDIVLPAVPALAADLGGSVDLAQLTVGLFFAGFGAGQLLVGSLADRFGRRPVLLAGLAAFVATSLACAAAGSLPGLLVLRTLQGAVAAAAPVLARAVVRDLFEGPRMAGVMSLVMAVFVTAPIVAPGLGALLLALGGWRAIFLFLAAYGTATALAVHRWLPETLPAPDPTALAPRRWLAAWRAVLGHPRSRVYGLVVICAFTVLLVYLSEAPVVFMEGFGLGPGGFGLAFAGVALFSVAGNLVNARLVRHRSLARLVPAALGLGLLASGGGLALTLLGLASVATTLPLFGLALFAFSTLTANGLALAMQPHARIAGAASSVLGVLHTVVPALVAGALATATEGGPATAFAAQAAAFAAGLGVLAAARPLLKRRPPLPSS